MAALSAPLAPSLPTRALPRASAAHQRPPSTGRVITSPTGGHITLAPSTRFTFCSQSSYRPRLRRSPEKQLARSGKTSLTRESIPSSSLHQRPQASHSDFAHLGRRLASSRQTSRQDQILLSHSRGSPGRLGTPRFSQARAARIAVVATSEVLEEPKTAVDAAKAKAIPKKKTPRPPKPKVVLRSTTMGQEGVCSWQWRCDIGPSGWAEAGR